MTQRRIYQEEYPYCVTFRTKKGLLFFENEEMATLLGTIMLNAGRMKWYDILAWQIMPDHIHVLVAIAGAETRDGWMDKRHPSFPRTRVSLPAVASKTRYTPTMTQKTYTISELMYTIKSYFIKQIREKYDIPYSVWHPRFYARIITTQRYLETVIHYIKNNPVKADLPKKYHKMPYQWFEWKKINNLF